MSKVDDYLPDLLCMGILCLPIERACVFIEQQIKNTVSKDQVRSQLQFIDWRKFFEGDGEFYEIKRFQIALFSIGDRCTVYVCNLADGWISLFGNTVERNGLSAYFFRSTLSDSAKFKVFEMKWWRDGSIERHLCALQDDEGWTFINRGQLLPFESSLRYQKRQIGARVNRQLIETYSEAVGFRMTAVPKFRGEGWRFWRET